MSIYSKVTVATVVLAMLAACGDTPGRRALTGAGIGAGVGAVGAGVTGGDPLTGAVIGGAVGGVTGAATKKKDINLGD